MKGSIPLSVLSTTEKGGLQIVVHYSDLIQAVQASLHTCPTKSLRPLSTPQRPKASVALHSIPLQSHPKIHDAELTAAEVTGVCANRFHNPAQRKHWQTLWELHVYLSQTILKPFPVAPDSSRWNSQRDLGESMVLYLCAQPSISFKL